MTTGDMLRGRARPVRTHSEALALWALLHLALTGGFVAASRPTMHDTAAVQQPMGYVTDPAPTSVQPVSMLAATLVVEVAPVLSVTAAVTLDSERRA